ncbi:MAG TPA: HAD family phosphatase [Povalibacter sp.]|uniref:HAD family hydrolase n=1 Tax=Povalibacter sp. TaxID=1962978 RepID=UPI002C926092|nr:HAD family phosphatase [Povalibacter sp.]HMN44137.1 HAD family phosphatase [Povalibacter sp.]
MPSIAFDCDGTLVDSEPLHNRADVTVLAQFGIVLDPQEHLRRSTGIGRTAMLRIIEQEHGVTLPADTQQRIEAELHRLVAAELEPIPSVVRVLTALSERGAHMAVASNSHAAYIEQALQSCGIRHFFGDRIASSDHVERLKPAPDIYLLAARMLGTSPAQCIAVEDSQAGVVAAHAAGMRTIAFCPAGHVFTPAQLERAGAQTVIGDFDALLDLIT